MSRPLRTEARTQPMPVRLSPAERDQLKQAAQLNHQKRSQFMRDAIVTAAADCLERAIKPRAIAFRTT
jgi:uncharacterized protein (DUF1778 family)